MERRQKANCECGGKKEGVGVWKRSGDDLEEEAGEAKRPI